MPQVRQQEYRAGNDCFFCRDRKEELTAGPTFAALANVGLSPPTLDQESPHWPCRRIFPFWPGRRPDLAGTITPVTPCLISDYRSITVDAAHSWYRRYRHQTHPVWGENLMSKSTETLQAMDRGTSLRKESAQRDGFNWVTGIAMMLFHVGAIAALFFFTWKALFVAAFLWWVSGSLGIGMSYHRLLTHRGNPLQDRKSV